MRSPLALLVVAAAALLTGCPAGPKEEGAPDAEALAALDPAIRRVAGLEVEAPANFFLLTATRGAMTLAVVRVPRGWELLDGAPHRRSGVVVPYREHEGDVLGEWVRPAGDRLLCSARVVGPNRHRLDPPQPLLVAPLTEGQRWTWEGTVDGAAASAEFHVRRAGEAELHDGDRRHVVEVEQVIRAAGIECTRVQTWADGRGLVREEGVFPGAEGPDEFLLRLPAPGEWRERL